MFHILCEVGAERKCPNNTRPPYYHKLQMILNEKDNPASITVKRNEHLLQNSSSICHKTHVHDEYT